MDFFKKPVLSLIIFFALLTAAAAADPVSLVTKTLGVTSLVRAGENLGPGLGASVQSQDRFETGTASIMDISLKGRAGLRLLPLTKIIVQRLDGEEPVIQLLEGNLIGLVHKGAYAFKVETPDADLRISEGKFWARHEAAKTPGVSFSALEGEARVSPKNSSPISLASKQAVDIQQGEALATRWASAHELQAIRQAETIEFQ